MMNDMILNSLIKRGVLSFCTAVAIFCSHAYAQDLADYVWTPPLAQNKSTNSMVMLTLSNDHQLYFKAYNDYDDIYGDDGIPDTTYVHNNDYAGYFDHEKCYQYSGGVFVPTSNAPFADPANGITKAQYCTDAQWSGNFLNWATMTRIDIVRQVLYGGKRSTDAANLTILERSYLPNDAHSFAKYYAGDDIRSLAYVPGATTVDCGTDTDCLMNRGVTFCNTTKHPEDQEILSQDVTEPPLLRVVNGNYSFWASSERFQCLYEEELFDIGGATIPGNNGNDSSETGIYAYNSSPSESEGTDYIVRVNVCGANGIDGAHDCVAYGSNYKPEGILQRYGTDGEVKFGLMTGGYNTNKNFGVLRKNMDFLDSEFDPSDGTFLKPANSMISTLEALRIVDYQYYEDGTIPAVLESTGNGSWNDPNSYKGTYNQGVVAAGQPLTSCFWGRDSFNSGQCRNWGNPFGELLAESYRYFSGAGSASTGVASDASVLSGLGYESSWVDPVDPQAEDAACVSMNVIGFNASYISYDDDFGGAGAATTVSALGIGNGSDTLGALTDRIGDQELGGRQYFVGISDSAAADGDNGLCTPKSITNLSSVEGVCPEAPRLQGSYLGAGLAHYVHTNDVRPDISNEDAIQTIQTIGVKMAGNQANIQVPVPNTDSRVTILPACRNQTRDSNCALVDFRYLDTGSSAADLTRGRYFVAWEDSEQGGDFDTDMNGLIEYEISGTTLDVYTRTFGRSSEDIMGFGFVISGTGNSEVDGFYAPSGINSFSSEYDCVSNATLCQTINGRQRMRFTINTAGQTAEESTLLETPLYFASKWGAFIERNSDTEKRPDLGIEWDANNDNSPDSYLLVTDPSSLRLRIDEAIYAAINKPQTSTSASVSVTNVTGEGLTLHTLYNPVFTRGEDLVRWVGTFNGLFTDLLGNFREDYVPDGAAAGNRTLGTEDPAVEFVGAEGETLLNRYPLLADGTRDLGNAQIDLPIGELQPIWDAKDQLAVLSNAQVVNQRGYTTSAGTGRYIYTGVDSAGGVVDGQIVASEFTPFTLNQVQGVDAPLVPLLDAGSADNAENVLRFTRGEEGIEGLRSRTVDWGLGRLPWRLGDIVNSSAAMVGRPSENFDVVYSDDSYRAYRRAYLNRRQVIYVGANDGLLHAFNAGFQTTTAAGVSYSETPTAPGAPTVTAHPLGSELWAYAPYNLLPHLKWLTDARYGITTHVPYVDSEVQKFDVNIFEADATHVGGWGTIIVVGMRFGGGDYTLDTNGDDPGGESTLRSAYMIFDVTDPEQPPQLLGEITHENLGYTFGKVAVAKMRKSSTGDYADLDPEDDDRQDINQWYLMFGSGPRGETAYSDGTSDQPAKLFSLNLNDLRAGDVNLEMVDVGAEGVNSHVGGVTTVDWDRDYTDDMVYFGLVGDGTASRGALMHAEISSSGVPTNVDALIEGAGTDLAFSAPPMPIRDALGNYWVYAGSGRFIVQDDLDLIEQNSYFGIKVNDSTNSDQWVTGDSIPLSSLKDVSTIKIFRNELGGIYVDDPELSEGNSIDDYYESISDERGWYRNLEILGENQFTRSTFDLGTVLFNAFDPNEQGCVPGGNSYIYALDMTTGLAQWNLLNPFQSSETLPSDASYTRVVEKAGTISGVASDTIMSNHIAFTKNNQGEVATNPMTPNPATPARRSWREISLDELQ